MKNILKTIKPAILISFLLVFLLVIYAPLEIYFSNSADFSFDCYNLLGIMAPLAFILFVFCSLFFALLNKISQRLFCAFTVLFAVAVLAFFIQGTFLASALPEMDGEFVDWSAFNYQRPWSIVLWLSAAILAIILIRKLNPKLFDKVIIAFSISVFAFLCLTLIIDGFSTGGFKEKSDYAVSDLFLTDTSDDENFIVFLVDAVDARAFTDVYNNHREYDTSFEDFTFYDNVLSCYPFTATSIPMILTGEWFHGGIPLSDYTEQAFSHSPLFKNLENENYSICVYDSDFAHIEYGETHFANFVHSSHFKSPFKFIVMQTKLVGLRFLPYDLKHYCEIPSFVFDIDSARIIDDGNYYLSDNITLFNIFSNRPLNKVSDKQFKFIYSEGAHVPFRYDSGLNIVDESDYRTCIAASMTLVNEYICRLKESGTYNNSVIVIMSDHGYFDPQPNLRQNPFLLVKGRNEHHPFSISDAPISHTDLQNGFSNLISGSTGEDVFPWKSGDTRERYFIWHQYSDPLEELVTKGHASDSTLLTPTGIIYELE